MPEEAHNAAMKELKRLKKMPQQMPEHAMIRYVHLQIHWNPSATTCSNAVI
jgi:ATP-dependent Lon protease